MANFIFYVKQESGLFRKGSWNVMLDRTIVGMHPDRETALTAAIDEANRTSFLGRETEIWLYEGDGFILHKTLKAQKPPDETKGGKGSGRDKMQDAQLTIDDPTFDGTAYASDASTDPASYSSDSSTDDPSADSGSY